MSTIRVGQQKPEPATRFAPRFLSVLLPMIAALVFGLLGIGQRSLWYDELQTSDAVINGLDGLFFHIWEAPLLPYYSIVFLWSLGGEFSSDTWIRIPSVIGFVIASGMSSATALRLAGWKAAAVTGTVVATSSSLAWFAHDARPYAIGAGLISISMYLLVRSWTDDRLIVWILYIGSWAVVLLVYPIGLAALPAHLWLSHTNGALLTRVGRWAWAAVALIPFVGLGAFLFVKSGERMHAWVPTPAVGDFFEGVWWIGGTIAVALAIMALLSKRGRIWLVGVLLVVLSTWLVSRVGASFWLSRSLIPFLGLFAVAASFVAQRLSAMALGALLGLLCLVQIGPLIEQQTRDDDRPWKGIVEFVAEQDADQRSIVNSGWGEIGFATRQYVPDAEIDVYTWGTVPPMNYWTMEPDSRCNRLGEVTLENGTTLTQCRPLR